MLWERGLNEDSLTRETFEELVCAVVWIMREISKPNDAVGLDAHYKRWGVRLVMAATSSVGMLRGAWKTEIAICLHAREEFERGRQRS